MKHQSASCRGAGCTVFDTPTLISCSALLPTSVHSSSSLLPLTSDSQLHLLLLPLLVHMVTSLTRAAPQRSLLLFFYFFIKITLLLWAEGPVAQLAMNLWLYRTLWIIFKQLVLTSSIMSQTRYSLQYVYTNRACTIQRLNTCGSKNATFHVSIWAKRP